MRTACSEKAEVQTDKASSNLGQGGSPQVDVKKEAGNQRGGAVGGERSEVLTKKSIRAQELNEGA